MDKSQAQSKVNKKKMKGRGRKLWKIGGKERMNEKDRRNERKGEETNGRQMNGVCQKVIKQKRSDLYGWKNKNR